MTAATDWLRCPRPVPDARLRLVCLPHAGGSAGFFAEWGAGLPDVEVHSVAYPGRAHRIDDELATDLPALASEIAEAMTSLLDRPVALFGHSLGAAVALETARALEAGEATVAHLFASGSRNGPLPKLLPPRTEDPDEVVRELVALGGTSAEMAEDPIFQELVVPYVVGDARMFHAYHMAPEPLLRCPVTSIVGDADADADVRPWAQLTTRPFDECIVRGNHFYLIETPPYGIITTALSRPPGLPGHQSALSGSTGVDGTHVEESNA